MAMPPVFQMIRLQNSELLQAMSETSQRTKRCAAITGFNSERVGMSQARGNPSTCGAVFRSDNRYVQPGPGGVSLHEICLVNSDGFRKLQRHLPDLCFPRILN